jgi:hypothetical protein
VLRGIDVEVSSFDVPNHASPTELPLHALWKILKSQHCEAWEEKRKRTRQQKIPGIKSKNSCQIGGAHL